MNLKQLINIDTYPVKNVLELLLKDKTTKKNIIFATNEYDTEEGSKVTKQITLEFLSKLSGYELQPRVYKSLEQQTQRTRKKAEVFTPSWVCNKMNNHCDEEWFGRRNVFNIETEAGWISVTEPITFPKGKTWKKYVDSRRLEITCGEAPYLVSRYDTSTGEIITIKDRIGILDRKLRVVNENTVTEEEWMEWAIRAFQSVYGYEFQGDNLLIARINLLETFVDYMQDRWNRVPTEKELKKIANIIVWNIWQMDGITETIPYGRPSEEYTQLSFFESGYHETDEKNEVIDCRIFDWRADKSILYKSLKEGKKK